MLLKLLPSGQTVDLTPMEFDILLLLARRPGQVFSARQIYEAVAADSFDASWTGISSMVYKLRRKLGSGIIETVRGHGYKFVAPGTSLKYDKRTTDLLPLCAFLFLTPVMRLRLIGLLLVFAVFFRYFGRLLQAFLAVINRFITNSVQQNALQMLKF